MTALITARGITKQFGATKALDGVDLAIFAGEVHVLLGVLVALTMLTCSAATIAFLPAVVLRLRPKFLTRT